MKWCKMYSSSYCYIVFIVYSYIMVSGADFNGHVAEGNRGHEEMTGWYGVKERNVKGQMVVVFADGNCHGEHIFQEEG